MDRMVGIPFGASMDVATFAPGRRWFDGASPPT